MNTDSNSDLPPDGSGEDGYKISLTRKIIMAIFIIAFWLAFYWHRSETPPATKAPAPSPAIPGAN
ncbi:MAG: hypothetical protein G3M78_14965 [Candidatus Nitrohelix vancouverensis]|uniref:Uncharacterized protein n=1 Tax=Candidatus Nitrohelix vancouverensis TaxID=2705534 RepID=A0A7T0G4Q3_9BACT|nr:MAG: hypothetical protein G3M78_14965 [Candidatus Nitrohelix vancouverensis]